MATMRFVANAASGPDRSPSEGDLEAWRTRMRRPENEIGWTVPLAVVLARTDDLAVAMTSVTAFTTGVALNVAVRLRVTPAGLQHPGELFGLISPYPQPGSQVSLDRRLLFGVEYADGRTATNLSGMDGPPGRLDDDPTLAPIGGSGDELSVDQSYFLSPVPPDGPLAVVCSWPAFGIAETRYVFEHADLTSASANSTVLWPRPPITPVPPPPPKRDAPATGWFAQAARPGSREPQPRMQAGSPMRGVQISTPYQPGTPLRAWSDEPPDVAAVVAELAIKASASFDAIRALIHKESLTVDEELSFGRLNAHCFLQGYEPMVMLVDVPRIDPAVPPLLQQYSKHFRTP